MSHAIVTEIYSHNLSIAYSNNYFNIGMIFFYSSVIHVQLKTKALTTTDIQSVP